MQLQRRPPKLLQQQQRKKRRQVPTAGLNWELQLSGKLLKTDHGKNQRRNESQLWVQLLETPFRRDRQRRCHQHPGKVVGLATAVTAVGAGLAKLQAAEGSLKAKVVAAVPVRPVLPVLVERSKSAAASSKAAAAATVRGGSKATDATGTESLCRLPRGRRLTGLRKLSSLRLAGNGHLLRLQLLLPRFLVLQQQLL